MSREKKSQVDDLTKLRRILDYSSDPNIGAPLSKDEKAFESVRRRLSGGTSKTQLQPDSFFHTFNSLEPKVTVHAKIAASPRLTTTLPKSEPSIVLPEFELVSTSTPTKIIPSQEVTFTTEDLFEVEKVDVILPEFLEVTPKEILQKPLETEMTTNYNETPIHDSNLPEWQPVSEEQIAEPPEPHRKPKVYDIPEFKRVNIAMTPEMQKKQVEWETFPTKEIPIETQADSIPTESYKPSFQKLSKKLEHETKRAQRKKEKEAKRLKKIELKQLKKEKREKDLDAKRITKEQHPLRKPQEEIPSTLESISKVETPQIKVNLNAFKGIESIDEKAAELLYKNGYFSIENIKDATVNDLVQIRGIKRKLAKQIKNEIEQKMTITENPEFVPTKQKMTKKKLKENFEDSTEWESYPTEEKIKKPSFFTACTYKEYTLYTRETGKHNGKKTTIHFFSKEKPDMSTPAQLPDGYQIAVNKKTGIPYLKKKR
jgi:hypothetical protein